MRCAAEKPTLALEASRIATTGSDLSVGIDKSALAAAAPDAMATASTFALSQAALPDPRSQAIRPAPHSLYAAARARPCKEVGSADVWRSWLSHSSATICAQARVLEKWLFTLKES